ncbi:MAG: CoA transferase, partial [Acinetobacter sp.]
PLKDKLKVIGSPIKLSRTPVEYKKAPPMLGEHTNEILARVADVEKLAELRSKGIIG